MMARTMVVAAVIAAAGLLIALSHWGCGCQESAKRIERELLLWRMDRGLLIARLAQPQRQVPVQQWPVSFLLEEPECAQRLLDHLRLRKVQGVGSGATNATGVLSDASATSDGRRLH